MPVQPADRTDFECSDTLRSALEAVTGRLDDTGFFFDFDGTLAEIQDDPQAVRPVAGAIQTLSALGRRVGHIGIISARNAGFLQDRLDGVGNVRLYGLYGLEEVGADGLVVVGPDAAPWAGVMEELRGRARRELPAEVYVEDKGLAVGLHYRTAPRARGAVERWADTVSAKVGVRVRRGRMVVELTPPTSTDKGTTLRSRISGLSAAWYFGDDIADIPAYAVLHERARADGSFSALAVAVGNDEIIDEVVAAADICVSSPAGLVALLRYVDHYLRGLERA